MKRALSLLLMLCLLLPVCSARGEVHVNEAPPEDWETRELFCITVFRTGEGDCMLLQAGGESMMVDGGPYKYREKLRNALIQREITHFKYLFSTHPHDDHIEGLRMLMEYGFEADELVSVFSKDFNNAYQKKAVAQAEVSGIPYRQVADGEKLTLGGAEMTVHFWADGKSVNARSAMLKITFGSCSALLCADVIGETQHHYLDTGADFLKADVVKAPHHGLTPFVSAFLTAVDPEFIWVTNYNNDKPGKTRDQANYRKLPILFSGAGTIELSCDGTDWYVHQTLNQF